MKRKISQLLTIEPKPFSIWPLVIRYLELEDILSLIFVEKTIQSCKAAIAARCLQLALCLRPYPCHKFIIQAYFLLRLECIDRSVYNRLDERADIYWHQEGLGFLAGKEAKRPRLRSGPRSCSWPCLGLFGRPSKKWYQWDYSRFAEHLKSFKVPLGMCKRIVRRFIQHSGQADNLINHLIEHQMPIPLIKFALSVKFCDKEERIDCVKFRFSELELDLDYLQEVDQFCETKYAIQKHLYQKAEKGYWIPNLYQLLSWKGFEMSFFQLYREGLTDNQLDQLLQNHSPTELAVDQVRSGQVVEWIVKRTQDKKILVPLANSLLKQLERSVYMYSKLSWLRPLTRTKLILVFFESMVQVAKFNGEPRAPVGDDRLIKLFKSLIPSERDQLLVEMFKLAESYDTRCLVASVYFPEVPPFELLRHEVDLTSSERWILEYNVLKLMADKRRV